MRIAKALLLAIVAGLTLTWNTIADEIPESCRQGGFAIGCQAWTFKEFTVFEAIEKTAKAGGRVIELFPNQKYSKDDPKQKFDHNASDEMIAKVKAHLAEHKVKAVNYGVIYGNAANPTEEEWRKVFEFAKKMGLYAITTEAEKSLDVVEKLVKEFDIKVAIHDHPKKPNDAGYKLWDPNYVLSLIKERDMRIGACADTGHWVRSGLKPVECLQILRGRIISAHLKDLAEFGKVDSHDVPYGTGVSDVAGILNELKDQGFGGNISVEYEHNWKDNVPDVAQCIGYVRGFGSGKHW